MIIQPRFAMPLALAIALAGCGSRATSTAHDASGLRTIEAGTGSLPFVLIHGYGASAEEWIPFTHTIAAQVTKEISTYAGSPNTSRTS